MAAVVGHTRKGESQGDRTLPADQSFTGGGNQPEEALITTVAAANTVQVDVVDNIRKHDESLTDEHPGRYRIVGELGEGGIGKVYIAYDAHLGRQVALKELLEEVAHSVHGGDAGPPSSRSPIELRFVNEARITGQLEHPGIVPVYELGRRADGSIYYAMRYVKGRTLEEALAGADLRGRLALLPHFVDLCNTLAYAHSRSVIHRDLKPENVMLGDFGETVLLDWGLAKVRGERDIQSSALQSELDRLREESVIKTVAGVPLGTPGYMSPEQALGQLSLVDERSDVYSLGIILYRLLTGTLPFDGKNAAEVIERLVYDEPVDPLQLEADCPPELAAIAKRAMEKKQERRYADAQALAADVRAFLTGGLVRAHSYSLGENLQRFLQRRKRHLAAIAAIVIVSAGTWWYRGVDEGRRQAQVESQQRTVAAASVDEVFSDVAQGNLQERWLDVFTFKLMALRNPVTEEAVVASLVAALEHPSSDVRRLAARSLSAVKSEIAVDALVARLDKDVEPSQDVVIEVINALGIMGDARAEQAVRNARVRAGQYSYIWNQTELAYRMIPLPEVELSSDGLDARDWNELGNALLWKGRRGDALAAFSRSIEKSPDDAMPYNNRAIVLRQLGRYEEALVDYDKVLALNPGDVLALNNRSLLRRQMEDFEAALADIDKVVNTGTLGVKALRNRSIIKRFMGDFRGAHQDLQLALVEKPNDARTYSAIAGTWIWTRDWQQALGALDQAISLNDKYTYAITQRALVAQVLGRSADALIDIDKVLSLDPADNYGRRMRATILMRQGKATAAKRDLDYCLENQCINDQARRALRHAQRGVVYFAALREHHAALDDLDKALYAHPRNVDAFTYELCALAIAMRAQDRGEQDRREQSLLEDHQKGHLWHNRVTRLLSGDESYEDILSRTLRPLERCAVALAGGIASERSGNIPDALSNYRDAADAGNPHDLTCILAEQAVAELE